jgi:hypothetical protein
MGAGEITLVVVLGLILFFGRQLPRLGEAIRSRPEEERRIWLGALFLLGAALAAALFFALKHAFLGR